MSEKIIIIGAGQAACSCAAKLRQNNEGCEILIVGCENFHPYQRPPLSKKYAIGEMNSEQLLLRPADWYQAQNIEILLGVYVVSIDREGHHITLSNDAQYTYDKLVFATGSQARKLPDEIGGNLTGVHVLRDLNDADDLSQKLVEGKKVLIVGGGYIGLEAAAVCASKGMKVILLEAADRILQRVACEETSDWFRALHQGRGVEIREGVGLKELTSDDNGQVTSAVLADDSVIETDFVLVGIGIIPNDSIARAAGVIVEGGIVLNENCQSSDPNIYAAGDCAVFPYRGLPTRLESVQNAIDQSECVADNINGVARNYHPHPWFWSDQYEVKLQIAGLNRGYDKIIKRAGEREGSMSHFYFKGESLLAVDAMNDPRTYMVAKKMLEAGKNITPSQAADTELVLKSLL